MITAGRGYVGEEEGVATLREASEAAGAEEPAIGFLEG